MRYSSPQEYAQHMARLSLQEIAGTLGNQLSCANEHTNDGVGGCYASWSWRAEMGRGNGGCDDCLERIHEVSGAPA